jgi:hypothetical protein
MEKPKEPRKNRALNTREKRFFKLIATDKDNKSIEQIAIAAGYSATTAKSGHIYAKIKEESGRFAAAFRRAGLTDDFIAEKLKESLSADRVVVTSRRTSMAKKTVLDENKQPVEFTKYAYEDLRETQPDYATRTRAAEIVLRAVGGITDNGGVAIQINLSQLESNL